MSTERTPAAAYAQVCSACGMEQCDACFGGPYDWPGRQDWCECKSYDHDPQWIAAVRKARECK